MLSRRLLRTKVLRSLYSHFKSGRTRIETSLSEYEKGVDKCYDLYLFTLQLLVEVAAYARRKQEIAAAKHLPTPEDLNPNRRFVDNSVIAAIANDVTLQKELKNRSLNWNDNDQVIKEIYSQIIVCEAYRTYMKGAGSDHAFITTILNSQLEDNAILCDALEDMSMFWADDLGYAIGQAIRSINGDGTITILDEFKNDEDRQFGEKLLLATIANIDEYLELIDRLTVNWELDRIAYMDRLILALAISEIASCPTIPIKVTMDEYIEISKYYSTPASSNFINGVLNKAVEELTEKGKIKKTGRGLLNS